MREAVTVVQPYGHTGLPPITIVTVVTRKVKNDLIP